MAGSRTTRIADTRFTTSVIFLPNICHDLNEILNLQRTHKKQVSIKQTNRNPGTFVQ